jgi:hypothetical protein
VAITLTESEAAKAAVVSADMVHMSIPIEKTEDTKAVNPVDGTYL